MSTILFKVWSKSEGAFLKHKGDNFFELWDFVDSLSGALLFPIDDFEFFKYSGFKDINGKSVFEGDIVRYKRWDGDSDDGETITLIKDIIFSEGGFFPSPGGFNCEDKYYSYNEDSFEVIGNIKENPDLLK